MKSLNGSELAGFIKERQAKQVRALRQADKVVPKLAIILCNDSLVSKKYIELKLAYGADILIDVELHEVKQNETKALIEKLNTDDKIHGIIVQLPLNNPEETEEILNTVSPNKDVDGLGYKSIFESATPMAIMWLLAGYDIDLNGKNIAIIGRGRLVGMPLKKMLDSSGIKAQVIHSQTESPQEIMLNADVIITAVGKPGIITSDMISPNCVVVDAAVASENGELKGDLAEDVYGREDLTLTPKKGGVGPLTVCALFDNVIRAAQNTKS